MRDPLEKLQVQLIRIENVINLTVPKIMEEADARNNQELNDQIEILRLAFSRYIEALKGCDAFIVRVIEGQSFEGPKKEKLKSYLIRELITPIQDSCEGVTGQVNNLIIYLSDKKAASEKLRSTISASLHETKTHVGSLKKK